MRRISFALLTLSLTVAPAAPAAAQDALVTSARQFSAQGQHDTAISMLRGALAQQPANQTLKLELASAIDRRLMSLRAEVSKLELEIRQLRGVPTITPGPVAGARAGSWTYTPSGATPVRVGGSVMQPMKIKDVKPVYPPLAREANVSGILIAEITIDGNGDVVDAKILRGQPLLNDAALDAVKQWKYTPTLLNGQPVPVIMTVTVTFTLQ